MKHSEELRVRLRDVILNTCNKIGCKNCSLKWEGGCSSTDLQERIDRTEAEEQEQNNGNSI